MVSFLSRRHAFLICQLLTRSTYVRMSFNDHIKLVQLTHKMKKQNERISTRLANQERSRIEELVGNGQFKNLSEFLRCAIEKLLERTLESR